jgi:hypothetical protein
VVLASDKNFGFLKPTNLNKSLLQVDKNVIYSNISAIPLTKMASLLNIKLSRLTKMVSILDIKCNISVRVRPSQ